eukprot:jgi/Botrbrau1/7793/Bobra.0159s0221.1
MSCQHQSKKRKMKRGEEGGTPLPCSGELGELVCLPKELLCHVFPGLPQSTVMGLSRSSRHCRQAAREAIPRIQAALVASVKDGWGSVTGAQMRTLMTLLERFAGCRDIATNEPLKEDEQGETTYYLSPEGGLHLPPQQPGCLRVECKVYPLWGGANHDRTGRQNIEMVLKFHFHGSSVSFRQEVVRGIVIRGVLVCCAHDCEHVDIGQALVLSFLPVWRGRMVRFIAPVRSLRECAAIIAGCDVVEWHHDSCFVRYKMDVTDWAPETGPRGCDIYVISH